MLMKACGIILPQAIFEPKARQRLVAGIKPEQEAEQSMTDNRPGVGLLLYFTAAFTLGLYFTFAAVQGDYGIFRRAEIEAETDLLRKDLEKLKAEVAQMENLTRRLSDDYLDLDLLDQQARDVLGMLRADEVVIR
jgi:cell division protein FtsB